MEEPVVCYICELPVTHSRRGTIRSSMRSYLYQGTGRIRKGGTRWWRIVGMTSRRGPVVSRERDRADPGGPARLLTSGQHAPCGNGRMLEVYGRHTGDLQPRERDRCGIPCQRPASEDWGVRRSLARRWSAARRGAARYDDDDDESAGDEESGEHSRRVENAAGATKDGGHRRSSAQERNLTPRLPNLTH